MKFIIIAVCLFGAVFAQNWESDEGFEPASVDDSTVVQLVAKGVEHHNRNATMNDGLYYKKLQSIVEAKYQVVEGWIYKVKFLSAKADCPKFVVDATSCQVSADAIPELCTYVFWVRPWLEPERILRASCIPAK